MAGIAYLIVFAFIPLVMSQTTPNPNDKIYNFTTWETDGESLKQFQLNGDANTFNNQYSASQRGGRLGLCRSQSYTAGSAYLLDPVNLDNNASFSTSFTLVMDQKGGISDNDGQGADGIVFIINSKTNVLGAVGQGIGYSGIGNSIGIEFDTYNNGAPIDYNGNHIGINIGGNQSSQMYFTVPKRMNDGDDVYGWVDYSGTDLQVRYNINNNTRPNNAILTYVVNLVKVFKSNSVYIGFSSATGGAYGAHYVKTWTFINKYQPLADIPLPITSSAMTTSVLSTAAMTTAAMTTSRLTTASMTTAPMTTAVMTTSRLTTASITTASMTTAAMTTKSMTTQLPFTTQALTTQEGPAITSSPISTSRMTTARMTTAAITTSEMTTSEFTTAAVTTKAMTTSRMTTSVISTAAITTASVTSAAMTTQAITTYSNLCANVTCGKISECHQEGICNPLTGKCVNNFANGITCDDGSVCTTADVCLNGKCVGTQITPCIPYILLNNQTTQIVPTQSSWLSLMFKGLMNITMFHVRILNYPTFNSAIDDGNYTESVIKYPGNSTETFKDYSAPNNYDGLGTNQTDFVAFKWVPAQTIGAISSIALSVEVNYTLFNGFNGANIHPVLIPVVPSTGYFSIANMDFDVPTGSSLWVSISIKGLSRLTDFRASLTDLNGILSFSYPNNLGYTSLQLNDYINVGETDYFAFRVIVPQTPKSLIIYPQLTIQWSDGTTILKDVRAGLFNIADLLGKRSRDTSDLSFTLDEVKVPAEVGSWVTLNVDAEADVTDVSFVLSSLILKFAYGNNQSNAVVGNIVSTESSFGAVWIDAPEGRYPVTATFTYKKGGVSLTSTQSFTIRSVTQPISVSTSSVSVVAGQSSIQSIGYSSQYSISEFIPQAESLDGWRVERVSDGKVEDASDGWLALFQITAPSTANGTFVLPISVQYNSGNEMDTTSFPVLVSVKASDATTTTNLQPDESDSTGSSKLSPGAVAGIAVGGVAGVALIAAAGVLVRKRRIRKVQPFRFQESIEMKNATATHPQVFMHKA